MSGWAGVAARERRIALEAKIEQLKKYRGQRCGCLNCDQIEDDINSIQLQLDELKKGDV